MPPVISKDRRSLTVFPPFSNVTAPAPDTEGMLNEKACGDPTCGCPMRLNRIRSMACASVAVPTVERELAPIRSWSTMIAGLTLWSASTSGRFSCPMNCCTNVGYVSLMSRCDSFAIVAKTSEDLPEPLTPVNTVRRRFGMSTLTFLRLFSRAPTTRIISCESAMWAVLGGSVHGVLSMGDPPLCPRPRTARFLNPARPASPRSRRRRSTTRGTRPSRVRPAPHRRRRAPSGWRTPRAARTQHRPARHPRRMQGGRRC